MLRIVAREEPRLILTNGKTLEPELVSLDGESRSKLYTGVRVPQAAPVLLTMQFPAQSIEPQQEGSLELDRKSVV